MMEPANGRQRRAEIGDLIVSSSSYPAHNGNGHTGSAPLRQLTRSAAEQLSSVENAAGSSGPGATRAAPAASPCDEQIRPLNIRFASASARTNRPPHRCANLDTQPLAERNTSLGR